MKENEGRVDCQKKIRYKPMSIATATVIFEWHLPCPCLDGNAATDADAAGVDCAGNINGLAAGRDSRSHPFSFSRAAPPRSLGSLGLA